MRLRHVMALAAVAMTACGGRSGESEIIVSAAASLGDAFTQVETAFEASNPGVAVALNLAGSSSLLQQILEGAPVDVFASANLSSMAQAVETGSVAGDPQIFVRNRLEIVVPAGNPGRVAGLVDFTREDLLIGLCAEDVPCGELGREALDAAGVTPAIDTDEPDAGALVTKIEAGELDAGIVYVTDVLAAGAGLEGIAIPTEVNVVADYPIAVVSDGPNPAGAAAFVAFVLSDEGQEIFASHGFSPP